VGQAFSPMPLTLDPVTILHKLWGSQSWLQPAFSRQLKGARTRAWPERAA
jgi:hypothetical protein